MKVVFRTDASKAIGTGHVMRCLYLAEALQDRKVNCEFVCRGHEGNLLKAIEGRGFPAISLGLMVSGIDSSHKNHQNDLLGATWEDDVSQTAAVIDDIADWIIVDHYGIDQDWESAIYEKTGRLMVIDDLANRKHYCDALVDQNWYGTSTSHRYDGKVPDTCKKFLGPAYAILDGEYQYLRKKTSRKSGKISRVLVFLGGSDSTNQTAKVLGALCNKDLKHLEVTVVIGRNHPDKEMITTMAEDREKTRLLFNVPGLAGLMVDSDLMIGAGGISNWERLCLGLPAIVLSIADNQLEVNRALAESALINYLGWADNVSVDDIVAAILECIDDPERIQEQGRMMRGFVHGNGAQVIASYLAESGKHGASPAH